MKKGKMSYIDKLYIDVVKQEFTNVPDTMIYRIAEWYQRKISILQLSIKKANETIHNQRQQILILDDKLLKAEKENSNLKKTQNE